MYGEGNQGGGFRPRGGPVGFAPVKVGDEIDVRIEAVGEKGDGIARKRGFILFVPNTREGDEVRIRVTKVLRKVGFAEVVGQAQGQIEGSAPAPREAAPAPEPMLEPEPAPEDTEDFGEEADEEPAPEDEEGVELPPDDVDEEEMDAPPEPPETPEEDDEEKQEE
ncbi:TRAM domain-containing protein [Candidatus Woesearchaeota archaeon]|nr:TRAM domain-containing protein [Candidatus Woesearchaeota archaeon]